MNAPDELRLRGQRRDIFAQLPQGDLVSGFAEYGGKMRNTVVESQLGTGVGVDEEDFHKN